MQRCLTSLLQTIRVHLRLFAVHHARLHCPCIPESDGGRHSPFFSGYRPQFRFQYRDNDCTITLIDHDQQSGGDTGAVALMFVRPELQSARLVIGDSFSIAEGARVVGRGTITKIHEPDMARMLQAESCLPTQMERYLGAQQSCNMVFTQGPSAHLGGVATRVGPGTIARNSGIARFGCGGVVKYLL